MSTTAFLVLCVLLRGAAASGDIPSAHSFRLPHGSSMSIFSHQAFLDDAGDTIELIIALEWVGRSTETADSCPYGSTMGSKVSAGLALSLDPDQIIFDDGEYTPPQNRNAVPPGNEWASWPHWHPYTWEVRHLRGTFKLSSVPDTIFDLFFFSPYYTQYGNILPINDNVYVYVNGIYIGAKGTFYEAKNVGMGGTAPFANETDGWFDDTGFGPIVHSILAVGVNVVDFVTEERVAWGAIGRLDLKLLVGASGCDPVEPWQTRTQGYWRRQCKENPHEDICAYVDSIHDLANLFDAFDCDSVCDLMKVDPPENDMCRKARRQFMALLLNVSSGRLAVCNCLEDGREVGDVLTEIDSLLSGNPDSHRCERAKTLADDINNGVGIVACDTFYAPIPAKAISAVHISATPTPFARSTVIQYELTVPQPVKLEIYDKAGRRVRTLIDEKQTPGFHNMEWDGLDRSGQEIPQGIYFFRLSTGQDASCGKLTLLR